MAEVTPIVIRDLTFRYGSRPEPAIRDVSLEVQAGEVLLIAGASGCGKTTLARCLNGLIPRSYHGERSGSVLLHGKEVADLQLVDISQIIGTVLQDPERQIVSTHVYGEVAFGPENLGLDRPEIIERVEAALRRLGIEHLRDRETFQLSGGEKQKLALAGVLAMRPSILLLDEPLASLDPVSAHEALAAFRRLADEGATVLMIEHRVEDALAARPDRLLYMDAGEVRYLGPVRELPPQINYHQIKLPAEWIIGAIRRDQAAPRAEPAIPAPAAPAPADPAGEPLIAFEDVSFAYGDGPQILHDIHLTIRAGDLVAILGPNGAGKSTLVKHAIGLLKPTHGRVLVGGRDTRKTTVAQIARQVGYVFQSPTHMLFAPTVREELAFGPQNLRYTRPEVEQNVASSVSALNLGGLEEFPPLGLSFGQQKRTAIAAVLSMRSRVLVMDEPTAGQDYANYTRFMHTLTSADPSGRSVLTSNFAATLFITHDVDLALNFANRVVLLRAGSLAADGRPEDVLCDEDLLRSCRIRPTSLLALNCASLPRTGRFHSAEALAALGGWDA